MGKRVIAILFLIIGLILIIVSTPFKLSGNVIAEGFNVYFTPLQILGLIFIFASFLALMIKPDLDAIVIPTGDIEKQDWDRTEKAIRRRGRLKENGYYVISGYKGERPKDVLEGQPYTIYNHLREHGIKPSQIIVEGKSHNTLQNVLYSLKKIKAREQKEGDERPWKVAFVSYPEHLDRFEDFEEQAIRKGLINRNDFKFYRIRTIARNREERKRERKEEKAYEGFWLRKVVHKIRLATMGIYKGK